MEAHASAGSRLTGVGQDPQRWENVVAGRYYEARVVRDLFGDWQVMRVWGGIGNAHGALRFDPLLGPDAAAAALAVIGKRRAQRGYVLRRP